jgi:hypothetical protein
VQRELTVVCYGVCYGAELGGVGCGGKLGVIAYGEGTMYIHTQYIHTYLQTYIHPYIHT